MTFDERHGRLTLAIAGLAALATYLDTTILFVAFPAISQDFGGSSISTLSWVLNGYTIVFASLLIPAGKLADRLGHRMAFLVGSGVFTVASVACGLAPNVELLIVARLLQGVGAATLIPASLALVMVAHPREKIPLVVAIWGAIGALSAALGPSLGALIVEGLGWRWAFFINLPIGIVTIVAGLRRLHESRSEAVRIPSLVGVVLIALAAASISFGVVDSENAGWTSTQTILALSSGVILLWLFVAHQRWTDSPTLDMELFAVRNFRWGNLTMLAFSTAFTAMFFGSVLFLVEIWHWSILKAGFAIAPGPALVAVLAPRFGRLAGRIGQRPIIIGGGALFALGGLLRVLWLKQDISYLVDFGIPLMLASVATAMLFPQITSVAVQALAADRVGVGGASNQAVRQFGATFGVAVTIALIGRVTDEDALIANFDRIWWALLIGGVLTIVCALPLRTGGPTLSS